MRRFHLPFGVKIFVLVWGLVLLVPQLHESFQAQRFMAGQGPPSVNTEELMKRFPNDPRILALQVQEDYPDGPDVPSETVRIHIKLDRYNALIRRFPSENWLRAQLIGSLMGRSIDMDFEGAPARRKRIADASALQKGLHCAIEAQKVEPDNAFFFWVEAIFRFGLGQKEAALSALQKAARGKSYNDYIQHGVQQRLAIYSLDHPLLFEEKGGVSNSALYLPLSKMQDARKAALQIALDARKRGDNQRALALVDAILGAVQIVRSQTGYLLGVLLSDRMTRETLEKINVTQGFKIQMTTDMSLEQRREYTIELARDFGRYARRFGRDDIARRAVLLAQVPTPRPSYWTLAPWDNWGVDAPWDRVAFQGNWFVEQMGRFSLIFAFVWVLSAVYLAYLGRKNKEGGQEGRATRGQVAFCANFSMWAMIGYGALAGVFGVGFLFGSVGWVQSLDAGTNEAINATLTKAAAYVAVGTWFLPVGLALLMRDWRWSRSDKPLALVNSSSSAKRVWVRRILWALAVLFGGLTFSNGPGYGIGLWDDTIFQWMVSPFLTGTFLLLALGFQLYNSRWLGSLRRMRLVRHPQSERWLFTIRLAGSSAGVLAVVWSLFMLMGGVGMWPLRATLNHAIEKRIAVGELEWMKQEIARKERNGTLER